MNKVELAKLLYGYKTTQCLYVAAKLNIADHLQTDSKNISELSKLTKTDSGALYRVLRCLSSLGIFAEDNISSFSLNPAAKLLLSDSEDSMKDFIILCGEELYQSAGQLLYSVKTGLPAFDHLYGKSFWDYLDANPNKAALFHNAMQKGTEPMIEQIISNYNFSGFKTIMDVGGGKGQLVCAILSKYPDAQGKVFDLPNAKKSAIEYLEHVGLTKRCRTITGDFFHEIPKNADLYLLKVVLHDWNDQKAKLILQNCRDAMHQKSKLLIIEKIVEDNEIKDMACLGDINMLVTLSGKERSLSDFDNLLQQTGFRLIKRISTKTVFSIIEVEQK